MARRSSRASGGSATPTNENPNVFADEFEVFDGIADGIVDGFGPGQDREGERQSLLEYDGNDDSEHDEGEGRAAVRSVSAQYAPGHIPVSPFSPNSPSRNSTRKSRGGGAGGVGRVAASASESNPFFSAEDDENNGDALDREAGTHSRATSNYAPGNVAHRSVSSASSHHFARSSSPRLGAGGPSHPYGLYPQGTMPRSPSTATQSTVRAPARQNSEGQGAPQHPYAMYPQGVVEDGEDEELTPQNPVTLGFLGQGRAFQRRRGPDGEEQDIVGEDGHLEQLPPYSRYPEEGHGDQKMPLLAAPMPLHSRAPVAGSDPSMPLMHDVPDLPRQQTRQSMTDQSELLRQGSRASMSHLEQMTTQGSGSTSSLKSNKSWSEKSWKEKRKTRFCGIPFWWWLLSICVLAFIAVVLSAVIGGFFGGQKHEQKKNVEKPDADSATSSSSWLFDASLIATPSAAAPATGTFALSLSSPTNTQAACLTDEGQQAAWDCELGGPPAAAIVVSAVPGTVGLLEASIFYASGEATQLYYGSQPDFMFTSPSPFLTVVDNDDPELGAAYYFQSIHDKVVVVADDIIQGKVLKSKAKRHEPDGFSIPEGFLQQKDSAPTESSKPWMCIWNDTLVEGFIYIKQNYSSNSNPTSPTSSSSPSPSSSSSSSSSTYIPQPTTWSSDSAATNILTTTITYASTTVPYQGPSTAFSAWAYGIKKQMGNGNDDDDDDDQEEEVSDDESQFDNYRRTRRNAPLIESLQPYPNVVKLEERRMPSNKVSPYCQQVQILYDGGWNWVINPDSGEPNKIMLEESDPTYGAYESAGMAGNKKKRQTVKGGCHCEWLSGQ